MHLRNKPIRCRNIRPLESQMFEGIQEHTLGHIHMGQTEIFTPRGVGLIFSVRIKNFHNIVNFNGYINTISSVFVRFDVDFLIPSNIVFGVFDIFGVNFNVSVTG
uniref:Uncharacterized protein n=1 Tax=Cacopsylla melanoneura TaxID=428564 RepID=A0A8D9EDW8_9HEMI